MNLYRGCSHNCVYCDGRAESYFVDGNFGEDVSVKVNAIDILRRELDMKRKRSPYYPAFIALGGGVGDCYQPIEEKYELTRQTLELISESGLSFPVHVITKSTLIERDIDILEKINATEKGRVLVSFSFSSVDDEICAIFEPGVPAPSRRLQTLKLLKQRGIACGMFLLPVIPFVTDAPAFLDEALRKANEIGLDYVLFGGMTLKKGRQKQYFYEVIKKHYPGLLTKYEKIYSADESGVPVEAYFHSINQAFNLVSKKYKIPKRIPVNLYNDILYENDLAIVVLEHIDYLLKLDGKKSPYGNAAQTLSKLKEPISTLKSKLLKLKGVGRATLNIVTDVLETGTSPYYERLLRPVPGATSYDSW